MPSKRRSIRPFGFKAKLFTRRRDADKLVEEMRLKGHDAFCEIWGARWKVYYSTFKREP